MYVYVCMHINKSDILSNRLIVSIFVLKNIQLLNFAASKRRNY